MLRLGRRLVLALTVMFLPKTVLPEPCRSSVPPFIRSAEDPVPRVSTLAALVRRVPLFTFTSPVKVLAPLRTMTPVPSLVMPNPPLTMPVELRGAGELLVQTWLAPRAMGLLMSTEPEVAFDLMPAAKARLPPVRV